MFKINTLVAWGNKKNCYMGTIESSNEVNSIVLVTSQSKGSNLIGQKVLVNNTFLGDITSGQTVVTSM